jgi:hypothetical protein
LTAFSVEQPVAGVSVHRRRHKNGGRAFRRPEDRGSFSSPAVRGGKTRLSISDIRGGAMRQFSAKQNQPAKANPAPLASSRSVKPERTPTPEHDPSQTAAPRSAFDFGRIAVHRKTPIRIQPKLMVGAPADAFEQEADRVADHVMRMRQPPVRSQAQPGLSEHRIAPAAQLQTKSSHPGDRGGIAAPPIVQEVLRSPGQPLDAATRAYMEPRFGHDFGKVRVHADARAAESARAIMARAYTLGSHIAFETGQYRPGMSLGRRLIAHELVHVVQQQATGFEKIQKQSTSHPAVPHKPLRYGGGFRYGAAETRQMPIPEKPYTVQDAKDSVTQRVKEKALTKGDVKGAAANSDAEIFLWYILGMIASPDTWGTENDLIAPIGWPAVTSAGSANATTTPGPSPVAEVTVRIDDKGAGVAELVSSKAIAPPKTSPDIADAETKLKATYGLNSVIGDKTWEPDELNLVLGAFALLPPEDKAALKGVDLKRVGIIDGDPDIAGQFDSKTAAVNETTTVAGQTATLQLADSAFADDATLFVGGGVQPLPRSYQTIVHEVGHAVEQKAKRDAEMARATTRVASNATIPALNAAVDVSKDAFAEWKASNDDLNVTIDKLDAANAAATKNPEMIKSLQNEYKEKKSAVDAKGKLYESLNTDAHAKEAVFKVADEAATKAELALKATRVPESMVAAAKAEMVTAGSNAKAALGTALKQSLDAKARSETDAYRSAINAVSAQLDAYVVVIGSGHVKPDAQDEILDAAIKTREAEKQKLTKAAPTNPALAAFAPVEAAQRSWTNAVKTLARIAERTQRVQRFVVLVNAHRITPFTKYAKDNWPFKPEEFFAEAYSLWRTDPEFLRTNAKVVFDWFEAGLYRA